MPDEPDDFPTAQEEPAEGGTLYALATESIKEYIKVYLALAVETRGFGIVQPAHIRGFQEKVIILGGLNSPLDPVTTTPEGIVEEWEHLRGVPFDTESAITKGVYIALREKVPKLLDELDRCTQGFFEFDATYISSNPHMLPIFQRLANIPSKAELKRRIGSVSDNSVSSRAAQKLAEILNLHKPGKSMTRSQLLQSIEPTLEGIVRDLVGRILLESIVAEALDDARVPYKREREYDHLKGVVYDFRADFVIPNETTPKAFVEVRKSSTRHASLYAKDKMFSAVNWKGNNKELLAILVVEGPWTAETLRVMAKVFDYIVPLGSVAQVAKAISAYLAGDRSKLRWIIEFSIHPATHN